MFILFINSIRFSASSSLVTLVRSIFNIVESSTVSPSYKFKNELINININIQKTNSNIKFKYFIIL